MKKYGEADTVGRLALAGADVADAIATGVVPVKADGGSLCERTAGPGWIVSVDEQPPSPTIASRTTPSRNGVRSRAPAVT